MNSMGGDSATNKLSGVVVHQPEEGAQANLGMTSDRFLRPKYAQARKNNFHLHQQHGSRAKLDASNGSQDNRNAHAQTINLSADNFSESQAASLGMKTQVAPQKTKGMKASPPLARQKKNSVDQI